MDRTAYARRRRALRESHPDGAILFLGQKQAPRNYAANAFPFRQGSHFLYYVGIGEPDLAAVLLPDGETRLYGPEENPEDLVWRGPPVPLAERAKAAGIARSEPLAELPGLVARLRRRKVKIHYPPPFRAEQAGALAGLLGIGVARAVRGASRSLARAIVEQRSVKSSDEVAEIESALRVTAKMHRLARRMARPGVREVEIAGALQGLALSRGMAQAYLPIVTVDGEILHNERHVNALRRGDLLLVDAAAESTRFYASDITRTLPVSGRFTARQAEIYQIVLDAQRAAIRLASPRVSNVDLHLAAARTIAGGLQACGLMRGDVEEAVRAGAHALFFPHGIGHMLGLDVHDMEDLGSVVGYPGDKRNSKPFGLSYLRLARKLAPGFVITVEPGIYFVPALIDRWRRQRLHEAFIRYDRVERYRGFGGIRIEDDILITDDGCRVLGPKIPKTIAEVEAAREG